MITKPDYCKYAKYYDKSNESGAERSSHSNQFIEKVLKQYKVKTILDLTCGTGSQVFWLLKHGYEVVGSDLSPGMLRIARQKARKRKIKIKFVQGDMCSIQVGKFDSVITIFNAVGHLTKTEFNKAMKNIQRNLKGSGLYLFDIFNSNMNSSLEAGLSIDTITIVGNTKVGKIQLCKINRKSGVMTMTEEKHVQIGSSTPKIKKWKWAMQIYSAKLLREMLAKNGFKVLAQYGPNGTKFSEKNSESIMIVAQRV